MDGHSDAIAPAFAAVQRDATRPASVMAALGQPRSLALSFTRHPLYLMLLILMTHITPRSSEEMCPPAPASITGSLHRVLRRRDAAAQPHRSHGRASRRSREGSSDNARRWDRRRDEMPKLNWRVPFSRSSRASEQENRLENLTYARKRRHRHRARNSPPHAADLPVICMASAYTTTLRCKKGCALA